MRRAMCCLALLLCASCSTRTTVPATKHGVSPATVMRGGLKPVARPAPSEEEDPPPPDPGGGGETRFTISIKDTFALFPPSVSPQQQQGLAIILNGPSDVDVRELRIAIDYEGVDEPVIANNPAWGWLTAGYSIWGWNMPTWHAAIYPGLRYHRFVSAGPTFLPADNRLVIIHPFLPVAGSNNPVLVRARLVHLDASIPAPGHPHSPPGPQHYPAVIGPGGAPQVVAFGRDTCTFRAYAPGSY